jgi:hypothetical protein
MRAEPGGIGLQQAGEAAERQHLAASASTSLAAQPGAQQQRQQFGVGQRGGPRASSFSRGRWSAGRSLVDMVWPAGPRAPGSGQAAPRKSASSLFDTRGARGCSREPPSRA